MACLFHDVDYFCVRLFHHESCFFFQYGVLNFSCYDSGVFFYRIFSELVVLQSVFQYGVVELYS